MGYVQQQDIHLPTATVREALRFSALLRQPASVSKAEKYEHVESTIELLGMQSYADAVVGVPGEGAVLTKIGSLIRTFHMANLTALRPQCRAAQASDHRRRTGCEARTPSFSG